jgi:peptidoglycan/xylan/chitin deacetylase (PgdA/CDA1 family)
VEKYHPVSLPRLIEIIRTRKRIPDNSVCVTFDDGYADNFWNAKPILEKFHVPATVFVTTGYVDSEREFWWDDLERIILLPKTIPDELNLHIQDTNYHWDLKETYTLNKQNYNSNKRSGASRIPLTSTGWDVTQGFFPTSRHRLYVDLHRLLKPVGNSERDTILRALCTWSGVPETGRPDYRALNQDEIRMLNHGGMIDIGSHTVTHSLLKSDVRDIQEDEIIKSKHYLEKVLAHEITSFSYPFGGRGDFSHDTETIVKNAEYHLACANFSGSVTKGTNPFTLPRYLVRNWEKDQFVQKMSEWCNG